MNKNTNLRWATEADYEQLGEVMFDAVRNGRSLYTEAQRAAWMPEPRNGDAWVKRLSKQKVVLQESSANVDGFMSLTTDNYIDFAYIRPHAQGTGLFRRLFAMIERKAEDAGAKLVWTHASLMAQPAFSSMGFSIRSNEEVELNGQSFKRALMEKVLV